MVERNENFGDYRFGFQGQEKDDEVKGSGNLYTATYWEYDSRLGRRWNTDPIVKSFESPYSCFGGNPLFFIDPLGDDWVNVHTARLEAAEGELKDAEARLEKANTNFDPYRGMDRKDAKEKGVLNDFKMAKKELRKAEKNYERKSDIYQREVKYEAIVNSVLKEWESTNPDEYAYWDKFDPNGQGIIDVEVSVTNGFIYILDDQGNSTGKTTTESINAYWGGQNAKDSFVKLKLKITVLDDKINVEAMTSDLVHGLGHIQDGVPTSEEEKANDYEEQQYLNIKNENR